MEDIKQCPFCASTKSRMESWQIGVHPDLHREYAMMCENCGAYGPNDLGRSGAIEMWNLRREKFPEPWSGLPNIVDDLDAQIKRRQTEDRILAAEMGMTVEEFDADVTMPDGG